MEVQVNLRGLVRIGVEGMAGGASSSYPNKLVCVLNQQSGKFSKADKTSVQYKRTFATLADMVAFFDYQTFIVFALKHYLQGQFGSGAQHTPCSRSV